LEGISNESYVYDDDAAAKKDRPAADSACSIDVTEQYPMQISAKT